MNHLPTIAIDFKKKIISVDDKRLKMQIWDTAGQERFTSLSTSFFKGKLNRLPWHISCILSREPEVFCLCGKMDGPDKEKRS